MKIENVESVEFTDSENELTIRVLRKKKVEVPEMEDCKRAPTIHSVESFSAGHIVFNFDGDGINAADILIKKEGVVVESLRNFIPSSSTVAFPFKKELAPGVYTLEMVPTLCKGPSGKRDFTIEGETKPEMEACTRGPTIKEINDVSASGLTFVFDGEGIAELGWEIIQNGSVLRKGVLTPVHNHPSIQVDTLAKGNYSLHIFGTKCKGASTLGFSVAGDAPKDPPKEDPKEDPKDTIPNPALSKENPGVLMTKVAGQTFGVINSRDFMAQITSDGRVKLKYDKQSKAMDGDIPVYAWLLDSNMSLIKQSEIDALTGEGLKLPEGAYHFYLYYYSKEAATTVAELKAHVWPYMQKEEGGFFRKHSKESQMVIVEVQDDVAKETNEVKTPRSVRSATWFPQYQLTNETIDLPKGKKMGIAKRVEGVPMDHLLKQVTQILAEYADVNNGVIPGDRTWLCMNAKANADGSFRTPEKEATLHYYTKGCTVHSQMAEDGWAFSEVEKCYEAMYKKLGDVKVEDTGIHADYWAPIKGYGTDIATHDVNFEDRRKLMANPANAKRARKVGDEFGESLYYATGAYKYRNRLSVAYLDSIALLLDAKRVYGIPMTLERQYIAMSDRRISSFGWVSFEGNTSRVERLGVWQRLPLEGGDILRLSRGEGSFEMLKLEVFYALLIGDVYVSWHDNMPYNTDISKWTVAHIGGESDWKTQFQPTGGQIEQYNPNNPKHPKASHTRPPFSDTASPGHNGGFVGSWIYSQIKNRVNQSLKYAEFSYNGQPGYFNGTKPVYGSLGNAEVSRFGVANAGQHNSVNQMEHRKPMVFLGSGTEGKVAIVINPYAGLTENTEYKFHEVGATINHVGSYLGVYKI